MKMFSKNIIFFFTITSIVYSCQKTDSILVPEMSLPCISKLELIPLSDTCFEPLPPNNFGFLPVYFGQKILYQFPEFDPSENEQFLYFHGEHIQGGQIVDFPVKGASFCTGEIWTIIDSIQFSYYLHHLPKWSEKGWILLVRWEGFNVPGERGLYKIKHNGDSLKLLLSGNVDYPVWINEGGNILCRNVNTYERLILDNNGTFLQHFPVKLAPVTYYSGKFAGLMHAPDLRIVVAEDTVVTKQLWPIEQSSNDFNGLDWLNEEEIVWINSKGIFRGNINTGEFALVKEVCPNIYYSSISAARDGSNRLLLTRRDYLFENGITDSMSVRYNISMYDLDTGEEFYVKLGEM